MSIPNSQFQNSSRLRKDLVRDVFEGLSSGISLINVLVDLNDISSAIAVLEGVVEFPEMPENFLSVSDELNEKAKRSISAIKEDKEAFFTALLEKYNEGKLDAVPLDLVDAMWLLIDEKNLRSLIDLLPEDTRSRQIENFLNIDVSKIENETKKEAILKYREAYTN